MDWGLRKNNSAIVGFSSEFVEISSELVRISSELVRISSELVSTNLERLIISALRGPTSKELRTPNLLLNWTGGEEGWSTFIKLFVKSTMNSTSLDKWTKKTATTFRNDWQHGLQKGLRGIVQAVSIALRIWTFCSTTARWPRSLSHKKRAFPRHRWCEGNALFFFLGGVMCNHLPRFG